MPATEAGAPRRGRGDRLIDHSGHFVMPGLIDVHTHLAYGNAKSEEDIDLYSPMEFRTLRGMFFAQKVAAAGYTAICSPGDAGQISPVDPQRDPRRAVRRAAGGGGRAAIITTHQGLTDWYPTWIGAPDDLDRPAGHQPQRGDRGGALAGQERRRLHQAGTRRHPAPARRRIDRRLHPGGDRRHRARDATASARKAISHSVGREATLYAARAGVDLIFHGFDLDDECIAAMLANGSMLCPTLTHPRNVDRLHPAARAGRAKGPHRGDREALPRSAPPT